MSEDKKPNKPDDNFEWSKVFRQFIILASMLLVVLYLFQNVIDPTSKSANLRYYSELVKFAKEEKIKSLVYYDKTENKPPMFKGEFKPLKLYLIGDQHLKNIYILK